MSRPFLNLIDDEGIQLGVVVVGIPVSAASATVQILAVLTLIIASAAATDRVRTAWRALPTTGSR